MFKKLLLFIPLALSVGAFQAQALTLPIPQVDFVSYKSEQKNIIAKREMPLNDRHRVKVVSDVFADNILLTLAYMSNRVSNPNQIKWDEVRKEQLHTFVLKPGEVFAFHDTVLQEFASKTVVTTKSHFNADQGFLSSGYLYGDGVCHLASVINWAARDARLKVIAPVNHDFAVIPDVPREYGTAIYYAPNNRGTSEQQNLYIQNTTEKTVKFVIYSNRDKVSVVVEQEK